MLYTDTIMYKEIVEQPKVLSRLLQNNDGLLSKIVESVREKKITQIVVGARGSSANAGTYFAYLAEIFTHYPIKMLSPSVITNYNGAIALDKSLVIGISQSGRAEDILCCLQKAKQDGSITLAITNDESSPIANEADFHLYLNAGKEESVAATKTVTSQMYLLLLLVLYLSNDPLLINAPEHIVNGVEQTISNSQVIAQYAQNFVNTQDIFVLARGLNFAVAKETALKLAETSYIKANAFSVAEFKHGPYAMIDPNATVLVLAPIGQTQSEVLQMAQKCKQDGAKVTIISNKNKEQNEQQNDTYSPQVEYNLLIPNGTDIETPFYNLVTAQLLANAISTAKELNPDKPRGLKKVTITK